MSNTATTAKETAEDDGKEEALMMLMWFKRVSMTKLGSRALQKC